MSGNAGEFGIAQGCQGIVRAFIFFVQDGIGVPVTAFDKFGSNVGGSGLVAVLPRYFQNSGVVTIHAWLEEACAVNHFIDTMMIVTRQEYWELKVATRFVIIGHVQMLEG